MAIYGVFRNQKKVYDIVQRLCCHHDHLKNLVECYTYMRQKETYTRMQDLSFRCNPNKMEELDSSYFTSLIIKLSFKKGKKFFNKVNKAYQKLSNLVKKNLGQQPEIYFDSAHITIKSVLDKVKQDKNALKKYMPLVKPIVKKWIDILGDKTELFGMGLFTNLHEAKGLSIGVRFYPTTPLVQILRGEIGVAL